MKLLAEKSKKGYCPLCGSELGESTYEEFECDTYYVYYNCGKCEAMQIEEVYKYSHTNAWKPMEV